MRTTAKATLSHYWPSLLGADHQWKIGGQVERGEHHATAVIPDRRTVRGQQRPPVPSHVSRPVECRRRLLDPVCLCQRRDHAERPPDDQCRAALRSQPRDQSGPAGARCPRPGNRCGRARVGHRLRVEHRVAAAGRRAETQCRWPNGAAGELRPLQPGRAHRRTGALPSRCDARDDPSLRRRHRRLLAARVRGRADGQPRARSPDAGAAHRRVLGRRRSRDGT